LGETVWNQIFTGLFEDPPSLHPAYKISMVFVLHLFIRQSSTYIPLVRPLKFQLPNEKTQQPTANSQIAIATKELLRTAFFGNPAARGFPKEYWFY
jgi:hypothetical protein